MKCLFATLIALLVPFQAFGGTLTVAAAADLTYVLPELARNFEQQTGNHIRLSFGSSGNLFNQIKNGAPYDLFFSADTEYPQKLISSGDADANTFEIYAVGQLAVWVPKTLSVDLEHRGIEVLRDPSVQRVAIANPQHAPYGRA